MGDAVERDERGDAFAAVRVSPNETGSMPDPCSFHGMKQGVDSPSPAASRGSTNAIARRLKGPCAPVGPNVPADRRGARDSATRVEGDAREGDP